MSAFDSLPATLARPSPPSSPRRSHTSKHWARRLERCCCRTFAYFPLLFVYGLTTWAVWVEVNVSFFGTSISDNTVVSRAGVWSWLKAVLGVALWGLANGSYSIAVFTSPGSPVDDRRDGSRRSNWKGVRGGYEGLPTYEDEEQEVGDNMAVPHGMTMVTAKSTGQLRYCKKCRTLKPDRSHHCSSCGQCVLKMDHHCPWLATCVGLRNYKPFLLFLIYTSLFCWLCFGVSASWVWAEIVDDTQMQEGLRVVNTILLAVLGGIIGLVLSGFTGWHIYLAVTGQTTIESLEKTRYLSPLRKSMETKQTQRSYIGEDHSPGLADQLKEIHANALPGVLRPEEGEESSANPSRSTTPFGPTDRASSHPSAGSPAKDSLNRSYASMERQREQDRYTAYLDEVDSEKLPNAFNMGWKRNLLHVFGDKPLFWGLPICNTTGDGWRWEVSPKWSAAHEEVARQRRQQQLEEEASRNRGGIGSNNAAPDSRPPAFEPPRRDFRWTPGQGFVNQARNTAAPAPPLVSRAQMLSPTRLTNGLLHQSSSPAAESSDMQMQPLDRRKGGGVVEGSDADSYDTSSDEDVKRMYAHAQIQGTGGWNDVPDELLAPRKERGARSRSRGRRKGD
ncbi:palmitoyltransferase for Vac8p [Friedmanniomyces endolithicus]|nr:palmitoyltransferase for Vac8p [Friedmanniomyces endolithicus]KAK0827835.1 palmitoyltransferase for Vac8p [Friedmanniomyces endolithicus]